ncbi:MAG: hypothetical protein HC836_12700 [Richelia sp. RM2_1_2]|nr:hypothetical protein [Richelia sp. RM2_1_2]
MTKDKIKNFLKNWAELWQVPLWIIIALIVLIVPAFFGIFLAAPDFGNLTIGLFAAILLCIGSLASWLLFQFVYKTFDQYIDSGIFKEDFDKLSPTVKVCLITVTSLTLMLIYAILCTAVV